MSVVALSAAYPCRLGGPVLTAADRGIFSARYFTHCMACAFCADACCRHGVDVDVENAARLRAAGPDFAALVGVSQEEWFQGPVVADSEFPGGGSLRTVVKDGACVFLDRENRGCKIHAFSLGAGLDYHLLKPMVSVLFPLTFEHGVLVAAGEIADGNLVCAGQGPSLYEGARDELSWYFGEKLVAELDGIAAPGNAKA